jgi:hypothetical protein
MRGPGADGVCDGGDSVFRSEDPEHGYYVANGNEIRLARALKSADPILQQFVLEGAFSRLYRQRGCLHFHASAVAMHGQAAVFPGASGSGKSTLAAGLTGRGGECLADDLCVLSVRAGAAPLVMRTVTRQLLPRDSMRFLRLDDADYPMQERKCAVPRFGSGKPLVPIGCIYVLVPCDVDGVRLETLKGVEKMAALLDNSRDAVGVRGKERDGLAKKMMALALALAVPVKTILRTRSRFVLEEMMELVAMDFAAAGRG